MKNKFLILPVALTLAASWTSSNYKAFAKDKADNTPLAISERQLKDLSEAIHNARHEAAGLVMECQRDPGLEGGEIDFIGTDIIPILPSTAEGLGGGNYLPPRPKYINLHITHLGADMPLVADEIGALKAPDKDEAAKVVPFISTMNTIWGDAQKHFNALGPLTNTIPYDQQAIITEATALNKDLEQIDKVKRDMYKSYRSDKDKGNGGD
jgi:hypothetical protein